MINHFKKLSAFVSTLGISCAALAHTVFAADATGAADATPAATTGSGAGGSQWVIIIVYIAIFVAIGYFLIFRPNKKRKQEEEKLRSSLTLGDNIVTIGGICGVVVNIKDDVVTVESSIDRTLIEFKNWAIREVKKLETDDDTSSKPEITGGTDKKD